MSRNSGKISCFVICPIGDKDAENGSESQKVFEDSIEVYEKIIQPACSGVGLEPVRADQLANPGEIPEQVFRRLREDDVVIADLTGGNPNVMYELGLRHTVDKLTISLGEKSRLPFDIAAIRTIMFKRTPNGLIEARDQLLETLKVGLDSGGDPVTATRVWLGSTASKMSERTGLSDEAQDLLRMLSASDGMVAKFNSGMSVEIQVNDRSIIPSDDPRIVARWVGGFDQLLRLGYIELFEGVVYRLTNEGYRISDQVYLPSS